MGTPFKERIGPVAIDRIGSAFAAVDPAFPVQDFARRARDGLDGLALKDRVRHVAAVLAECLPEDYAAAIATVEAAAGAGDLTSFEAWPLVQFVEDHGLADPAVSYSAIHGLTRRFSCEFAIRTFLDADTDQALRVLRGWAEDPDEHVRRLVSEGSRTRLPWGRRLRRFQEDPAPVLALLDLLYDDESEYVRRSVANSLNDISKDHPAVAVDTARRWLGRSEPTTPALVRHGLRTLVKAGDTDALALLGVRHDADLSVQDLRIDGPVRLGHTFTFSCTLLSHEPEPVEVEVDYVLHRRVAGGSTSPKVWKLTRGRLDPGEPRSVRKRHSLRETTVRTWRPGTHRLEIQVNGRVIAGTDFEVTT